MCHMHAPFLVLAENLDILLYYLKPSIFQVSGLIHISHVCYFLLFTAIFRKYTPCFRCLTFYHCADCSSPALMCCTCVFPI